ncbi:DUF1707 SHOCT-like domain-containing protein [Umezawaea beigongshangensis]|uniref:DUF1707 SHOCT-like domain-containing protein n=1 Tax=Umezawaea beigongshangensis TaxID=2780383 RepID=UPI0018F2036C|nr:DUF1707 domain-containing protein [Umezawaea beigongshangensis]
MTDPRDLRVSDAEREHVVGVLQKAIGQGMITLDEFSERTDLALAAKTRGDLNAVVVDLPGVVNHEATLAAAPRRDQVELKNTMSSISRKGRWTVPRELVLRNRMGSTELDFGDAVVPHDVVSVVLDVTAGSVKLVLPEGSTVSSEDVEVSAGTMSDRVGEREHRGRPHFVVTGTVRAGSVEISRVRRIAIGGFVVRMPGFRITRA